MDGRSDVYHSPGLTGPCVDDLRALSEELKFKFSQTELEQMAEMAKGRTQVYQRLSELKDPSLPLVKYPRTPGFRPDPEDNPYNAWAWCCDIQGASGGKLSGKTVAIKDNTAVAGVPMRNGSKILDGYVPEFDATIVTRILDAGGRIKGKSAVEDMCMNLASFTCSDGPVRNPHDQSSMAGGSSSGSAVLVAAGVVDVAIGGDQAGSIRVPASMTGIVGLKPTWGLVPYTGASSMEPTTDHLGPMARNVADCALLLEVIAGYDDGRDPRQTPSMVVPEYTKLLDVGVAGKRVGLLTEGFEACTDGAVSQVVRQRASDVLTRAGCSVHDVSIPLHKDGVPIWLATGGMNTTKNMFENNGVGIGNKGFNSTSMHEAMFRGQTTHPHDLPPGYKYCCLFNTYLYRTYGAKFYAKGQNLVLELTRQYDNILKDFDVIVMPTVSKPAQIIPSADTSFADIFKKTGPMISNNVVSDITGHPALSINAGFHKEGEGGLPIGMMIVGRKFDEVTVLQVAKAFEQGRNELLEMSRTNTEVD